MPIDEACEKVLFSSQQDLTAQLAWAHLNFDTETLDLQGTSPIMHHNPAFSACPHRFHGLHDGILTLTNRTFTCDIQLLRLRFHRLAIGYFRVHKGKSYFNPFRKPEKLLALCLFRARKASMPIPTIDHLRVMPGRGIRDDNEAFLTTI